MYMRSSTGRPGVMLLIWRRDGALKLAVVRRVAKAAVFSMTDAMPMMVGGTVGSLLTVMCRIVWLLLLL